MKKILVAEDEQDLLAYQTFNKLGDAYCISISYGVAFKMITRRQGENDEGIL